MSSQPLSVVAARLLGVQTFTIVPQGAFSLRESVEFGFGQRHAETYDATMRLAFVLDPSMPRSVSR